MAPPIGKKQVKLNALLSAIMLSALMDSSSSAAHLSEVSGLHITCVWRWLRALRSKGVVHVCGWDMDTSGRRSIALYALGRGKDVPRPKTTPKQRLESKKARNKVRRVASRFARIGAAIVGVGS